jgi:deazaflavin-dependent oxidoreductase (nitroreductase family)
MRAARDAGAADVCIGREGITVSSVAARRIQTWAEKYLFNPWTRVMVKQGLAPRCYVLVETTGRRTGELRLTPVAGSLEGDTYWLVAEHGGAAGYVKNLAVQPRVRVLVDRRWRPGTATCLPDDDASARRAWIDKRNGIAGRLDGIFFRAFSTTPMTVRIDFDS